MKKKIMLILTLVTFSNANLFNDMVKDLNNKKEPLMKINPNELRSIPKNEIKEILFNKTIEQYSIYIKKGLDKQFCGDKNNQLTFLNKEMEEFLFNEINKDLGFFKSTKTNPNVVMKEIEGMVKGYYIGYITYLNSIKSDLPFKYCDILK